MSRRLIALALIAASAGLSACGTSAEEKRKGETEAAYIRLGKLDYQVQISRTLNPSLAEDADYLKGLPPAVRVPPPGQKWFAVFLQVRSDTDAPQRTASRFFIRDTQHKVFRPVPLSADSPFAYHASILTNRDDQYPDVESTAHYGPTQGALLLFRVPVASLDNRPLELFINQGAGAENNGVVTLDV